MRLAIGLLIFLLAIPRFAFECLQRRFWPAREDADDCDSEPSREVLSADQINQQLAEDRSF